MRGARATFEEGATFIRNKANQGGAVWLAEGSLLRLVSGPLCAHNNSGGFAAVNMSSLEFNDMSGITLGDNTPSSIFVGEGAQVGQTGKHRGVGER